MNTPEEEFDTEAAVGKYREVVARIESESTQAGKDEFRAVARRLRQQWKDWQGEDSLHEMTFGEQVD